MRRSVLRELFAAPGPAVVPVIHVRDESQCARNVDTAIEAGAPGVFLINHDFGHAQLLPVIAAMRARFPELWLGVNFLGVTGADAFPVLGRLAGDGVRVDAYWADDARIDERLGPEEQSEAAAIDAVRRQCGWGGLYFGGTAFKKQRPVDPDLYEASARLARAHMDVVTTSGVATGEAADLAKIEAFRRGAGDAALALASGVTAENAARYARLADCFMVATGINRSGDFYNIDPDRLRRLMVRARETGGTGD